MGKLWLGVLVVLVAIVMPSWTKANPNADPWGTWLARSENAENPPNSGAEDKTSDVQYDDMVVKSEDDVTLEEKEGREMDDSFSNVGAPVGPDRCGSTTCTPETPSPTPSPIYSPTYPPTNPPTYPPTNPPTYPPTNPPTYPPTNPPTYPPTNPPTYPPTNPPTYPPTNPPTYPPTNPPTYPPTNPPTYPPTNPPTYPPTWPTPSPTHTPTPTPTPTPPPCHTCPPHPTCPTCPPPITCPTCPPHPTCRPCPPPWTCPTCPPPIQCPTCPPTHPTHPTCPTCPPVHPTCPPSTTPINNPTLPSITYSNNCDFCDHDLYKLTCIPDAFTCAARCAGDWKCTHFTYISNVGGGTCLLKRAVGSGGAWASIIPAPSPYVCGFIPKRAFNSILLNICVGLDVVIGIP